MAGNTDLADALYLTKVVRTPGRLTWAQAEALANAYLEAQTTVTKLRVEAKRLADDASAQRAVVERLTDELNDRKEGHG